jgi:hypothetical protein
MTSRGTELHAVQRWSKLETEGAASHIFGTDDTNYEEEEKEEGATDPVDEVPILAQVLHAGNRAEDIAEIRGLGFTVDDNNKPAPVLIKAVGSFHPPAWRLALNSNSHSAYPPKGNLHSCYPLVCFNDYHLLHELPRKE